MNAAAPSTQRRRGLYCAATSKALYHSPILSHPQSVGNTYEHTRQSNVHGVLAPPAGAYFDPRVQSYSFHAHALPAPAVAGSAAHTEASSQNDTLDSALINFAGAICLCIVAAGYASPDNLKAFHLVVASVTCGTVGSMFTLATLALHRGQGRQCFLLLSLLSAAAGTVIMVAATQTWEIAMLASVCIAVTAGVVWRLRTHAR
ncbi:unnamed protein product [Peniophora sp. CBMAI 1063]|nr:unnamed protein product [Peniophora sp. CBMAI 1063]